IPVRKGWNWIGYTPDDGRSVASALTTLVAAGGDVLRSQTAFTEFASAAWAGSLGQMAPGLGYALYHSSATAGQFAYGDVAAVVAGGGPVATPLATRAAGTDATAAEVIPGWEVDD